MRSVHPYVVGTFGWINDDNGNDVEVMIVAVDSEKKEYTVSYSDKGTETIPWRYINQHFFC